MSQIIESGGRAYFFLCNVAKSDEIKLCAQQIFNDTKIGMSAFVLTVVLLFFLIKNASIGCYICSHI